MCTCVYVKDVHFVKPQLTCQNIFHYAFVYYYLLSNIRCEIKVNLPKDYESSQTGFKVDCRKLIFRSDVIEVLLISNLRQDIQIINILSKKD